MTAAHDKIGSADRKPKPPIKVMLVDDSVVARSIFERILTQTGQIEIVFQAEDSETALTALGELNVTSFCSTLKCLSEPGLRRSLNYLRTPVMPKYWLCRHSGEML